MWNVSWMKKSVDSSLTAFILLWIVFYYRNNEEQCSGENFNDYLRIITCVFFTVYNTCQL